MKSDGKLSTWRVPLLVSLIITSLAALELHHQGRRWTCACGRVLVWMGDAWSAETSQQLFDPYSFTHLLHGFAFCGLLALVVPRASAQWRFSLAILIESVWEIAENTNFVINRYRETTAAFGYTGDTVINSVGDICACACGFLIARRLGWRRTLVVFVAIELILLVWIRDSLLLNVLMLIHKSDAIKAWQAGH
ncbi:MAG: hypothetical protein QOE33_2134 [Acidobacteriota bacterium]|nr:hypothetical protein [Acidobacteriota bacterium]